VAQLVHPQIPGLVYQKDLGSGGFADVYLYRRQSPDRLVAVKVLRTTDMSDRLARRFTAEADAMAALDHPYIAKVYSAGITNDGRPYIEMAYYPNGSLEDRVRQAPLSVPDVLRIGVQLCSAVETAHRLEPPLLHRDIKPANVLIDAYGDPMLTDFGIASRMNDERDEETSLSVYWASPEAMFSTSPVDKRSDVYSLGAMLWHLLVGRAPYMLPGGDNRPSATMIRTRDLPVPSTGRPDVPASLERLLASTMSKDPRLRPATAADLARSLNAIEQHELGFGQVTPFKVRQAAAPAAAPQPTIAPEDRTRLQAAPQVIPAQTPGRVAPAGAAATLMRGQPQAMDGRTIRSSMPATADAQAPEEAAPRNSRAGLVIAAVIVALVLIGVGWWLLRSIGHSTGTTPTITSTTSSTEFGLNLPPGPVLVSCTRGADGVSIACSWDYDNNLTTDAYQILLPDGTQTTADAPSYTAQATGDQPYCIKIKVVRADGRFPATAWSEAGCA